MGLIYVDGVLSGASGRRVFIKVSDSEVRAAPRCDHCGAEYLGAYDDLRMSMMYNEDECYQCRSRFVWGGVPAKELPLNGEDWHFEQLFDLVGADSYQTIIEAQEIRSSFADVMEFITHVNISEGTRIKVTLDEVSQNKQNKEWTPKPKKIVRWWGRQHECKPFGGDCDHT